MLERVSCSENEVWIYLKTKSLIKKELSWVSVDFQNKNDIRLKYFLPYKTKKWMKNIETVVNKIEQIYQNKMVSDKKFRIYGIFGKDIKKDFYTNHKEYHTNKMVWMVLGITQILLLIAGSFFMEHNSILFFITFPFLYGLVLLLFVGIGSEDEKEKHFKIFFCILYIFYTSIMISMIIFASRLFFYAALVMCAAKLLYHRKCVYKFEVKI